MPLTPPPEGTFQITVGIKEQRLPPSPADGRAPQLTFRLISVAVGERIWAIPVVVTDAEVRQVQNVAQLDAIWRARMLDSLVRAYHVANDVLAGKEPVPDEVESMNADGS